MFSSLFLAFRHFSNNVSFDFNFYDSLLCAIVENVTVFLLFVVWSYGNTIEIEMNETCAKPNQATYARQMYLIGNLI